MRNKSLLKGTSSILAAGLSLGLLVPTTTLILGCSTSAKDKASSTHAAISGFYATNSANAAKTTTASSITITKGDTVWLRANYGTTGGTATIMPGNFAVVPNVPINLGALSADATYTLTVTNDFGESVTATVSIHAVDAPATTITAPSSVVRDTPGLTASVPDVAGSTYTWTLDKGVITSGADTHTITFTSGSAGSAGAASTMTLTCKVTNAAKLAATSTATFPVVAIIPSALTYPSNSIVCYQNVPFTAVAPTYSGDAVQSFSIAPALPAGLNFDTTTGRISGTPTAATANATYTVSATNSGGTAQVAVQLMVDSQPSVTLMASPSTIGPNGGSILTWAVDDSVSGFTIDQGVQTTVFDTTTIKTGTFNVHPSATTLYTMTANLVAGGSVQQSATVTLDSTPLTISSFTAEKLTTTFGASDKLSWTLTGTPNSLLLNGASVLGTSNITLVPARRQLFHLNAVNGNADVSSDITVAAMGLDLVAGNIAGAGTADSATASTAQFNAPRQIAADAAGNIFVADAGSHTIRRVATSGAVTTISGMPGLTGSTDGTYGNALLNAPRAIAVSADGTNVYVMDCGNKILRKVNLSGGVWTTSTIAGVTFGGSGYGQMTLDPTGAFLLAADYNTQCIRIVRLSDGASGIYAGTSGFGHFDVSNASLAGILFDNPEGIAFNKAGTYFYVLDAFANTNNYLRAVQWVTPPASGALTQPIGSSFTVAGAGPKGFQDGTGSSAYWNGAAALCVDSNDVIWMTDSNNSVIRTITVPTMGNNTGVVTTVAGTLPTGTYPTTGITAVTGNTDGALLSAKFNNPQGILAIGSDIYVSEVNNSVIRKISGSTVSTPIGMAMQTGNVDGSASAARFSAPLGIACGGGFAYVADTGNGSLRKIQISDGATTTLVTGLTGIKGTAVDKNGLLYVTDVTTKAVYQVAANGTLTTILNAGLTAPQSIAVSPLDPTLLYVIDGNAVIEIKVTRQPDGTFTSAAITNTIGSQASTGLTNSTTASAVRFKTAGTGYWPGLAVDASGNVLVADYGNSCIRKITFSPAFGVTTFAGSTYGFVDSTTLTTAKFNYPTGILIDPAGNIFIAEKGNHTIRKIDAAGTAVTTVIGLASGGNPVRIGALAGTIGTGGTSGLYQPYGIAMDSNGDLFVVTNNGVMQATLIGSAQ